MTVTSPKLGPRFAGVVDSGAPLSVASWELVQACGVAVDTDPIMTVPLGLGGTLRTMPVFALELELVPPRTETVETPVHWSLPVAVQVGWRFPFAILLGQRGWFDTFTTVMGTDWLVVGPASRPEDHAFG